MPTRLMSHRNTLLTGLVCGPLAITLAACGGTSEPSDDTEDGAATTSSIEAAPTTPPPAPASSDAPPASSTPTSRDAGGAGSTKALLAAAATGLRSVPQGTLVSTDRNASSWEVHVVTGDGREHEMDVALDGRSVTRGPVVDRDDADDRSEQSRLVQTARVGYRAAAGAATAEVPGGQLSGLDLGLDDGRFVWDANVLDKQRVERTVRIDAVSGKVLTTEYDD